MSTVRFTSRSGRDGTIKFNHWGGPVGPFSTGRTQRVEPAAPGNSSRGEPDNRQAGTPNTHQHRRCTP